MFYRSFYEAIKELPPEDFKKSVSAIMEYGLNEKEPETAGIEKTIYLLAKPQIDANNRRYQNGTKGGRPRTGSEAGQNQEITKPEPKNNQAVTKQKPSGNQTETKPEPKEKDKVKEKEKDNDKKSVVRFAPPSLQDVTAYCQAKGYTVDAERFIDYYSSQGWMVGKNKMKDWKAAVRNWNRSRRQESTTKGNKFSNCPQRNYDMDSLEAKLLGKQ